MTLEQQIETQGKALKALSERVCKQDAALRLAFERMTELQEDLTKPLDGYHESISIAIDAIKGLLK